MKMTENEFLGNVTYSTNHIINELTVWWGNQILATLDFSNDPKKLQDDDYCTTLAEEVALQSSLSNMIEK